MQRVEKKLMNLLKKSGDAGGIGTSKAAEIQSGCMDLVLLI
jgi:hypothetical protein